MDAYLYEKNYDCYKKTQKKYSKDTMNLVEYTLITKDYLKEGNTYLSNIYKIMTILYGNQVSKNMKEEYLMLLSKNIIALTDYQNEKIEEIFKPNGRILTIKDILKEEALSYINSRGVGDIQETGSKILNELDNSSNNDLRNLTGSCSIFKPFVDGYYYEVCKKVGEDADTNFNIDLDYNLTLEATNRGENNTTKDVIEDLYCYVEGTKYNTTAYLSVDSIVYKAMYECMLAINKIDKYGSLTKKREIK